MLILTRKVDEVIVIGDHIKVTIIEIRGKQIRLGIEAPPGLLILREEEKLNERSKGSLTKLLKPFKYVLLQLVLC